MRICFVSEPLFPITGTSSRTLCLAKALAKAGHEVFVVAFKECYSAPPVEDFNRVKIVRLDEIVPVRFYRERVKNYLNLVLSGRIIPVLLKLVKILRELQPDVVHCANYFSSLMGISIKGLIESPVVADLHASARLESMFRGDYVLCLYAAVLEQTICRLADGVITPTSAFKNYLVKTYRISDTSKIEVVPNCIEIDEFRPRFSREEVRAKIGVGAEDLVIFFHGSPYPENLRALAFIAFLLEKLNKSGINVKALVAGRFENIGIRSPYIVYLGYVEDLPTYMNAADLAVLPVFSVSLGIRSRILEYMACGLPVVTLRKAVLGMEYLLNHDCILAVDNLDDFFPTLVELLSRIRKSKTPDKSVRELVLTYFSPERIVNKLENFYAYVLSKSWR